MVTLTVTGQVTIPVQCSPKKGKSLCVSPSGTSETSQVAVSESECLKPPHCCWIVFPRLSKQVAIVLLKDAAEIGASNKTTK
jgi:hypothetical protein